MDFVSRLSSSSTPRHSETLLVPLSILLSSTSIKVKAGNGDPDGFRQHPFCDSSTVWQFDFHDPDAAQTAPEASNWHTVTVEAIHTKSNHTKAVVCDLRLWKPKTGHADTRLTLDPWFASYLSQYIRTRTAKAYGRDSGRRRNIWLYDWVPISASPVGNPEPISRIVHRHIMDILETMSMDSFTAEHQSTTRSDTRKLQE